jgi:hypothetical protein
VPNLQRLKVFSHTRSVGIAYMPGVTMFAGRDVWHRCQDKLEPHGWREFIVHRRSLSRFTHRCTQRCGQREQGER